MPALDHEWNTCMHAPTHARTHAHTHSATVASSQHYSELKPIVCIVDHS